jgi:hypothetical protein
MSKTPQGDKVYQNNNTRCPVNNVLLQSPSRTSTENSIHLISGATEYEH